MEMIGTKLYELNLVLVGYEIVSFTRTIRRSQSTKKITTTKLFVFLSLKTKQFYLLHSALFLLNKIVLLFLIFMSEFIVVQWNAR